MGGVTLQGYANANQTAYAKAAIKWGADYLMTAHFDRDTSQGLVRHTDRLVLSKHQIVEPLVERLKHRRARLQERDQFQASFPRQEAVHAIVPKSVGQMIPPRDGQIELRVAGWR